LRLKSPHGLARHTGRAAGGDAAAPLMAAPGATLALKDGDWGLIAHCHAGCRRTDIMAELQKRGILDAGPSKRGPAIKKRGCEAEEVDCRRRIRPLQDDLMIQG
jgi:hypothetical protein